MLSLIEKKKKKAKKIHFQKWLNGYATTANTTFLYFQLLLLLIPSPVAKEPKF